MLERSGPGTVSGTGRDKLTPDGEGEVSEVREEPGLGIEEPAVVGALPVAARPASLLVVPGETGTAVAVGLESPRGEGTGEALPVPVLSAGDPLVASVAGLLIGEAGSGREDDTGSLDEPGTAR